MNYVTFILNSRVLDSYNEYMIIVFDMYLLLFAKIIKLFLVPYRKVNKEKFIKLM